MQQACSLSLFFAILPSAGSLGVLAAVDSSWILHSLLPFVIPSPSDCCSPRTLPPLQAQLLSTLSNTPVCYTNTRTQALTCAQEITHAGVRGTSAHSGEMRAHTKGS